MSNHIQESGAPPLKPDHICFSAGHIMYSVYILHNHQSSWGQHKCARCGYAEDWQYDFHNYNPMFNQSNNQ